MKVNEINSYLQDVMMNVRWVWINKVMELGIFKDINVGGIIESYRLKHYKIFVKI